MHGHFILLSDGDIWSGTEQHPSYNDGVKNYGILSSYYKIKGLMI